jgi:cellulose synthase/poly-beta-1,6-N-acetylglucosamine synthase-like glycosyltransferase
LRRTKRSAQKDQIVLVLDADSVVSPGCLDQFQAAFTQGALIVQARVEPLTENPSPFISLVALSELAEQHVYDRLRRFLGWSVRLRGTGMAFRRWVLEEAAEGLHTVVEDVELTVKTVAERIPIHFLHEAYVLDPKPTNENGAVRQRARWLQGQWQVLKSYKGEILRILLRGPAGWSVLGSVLLKPKTFVFPMKVMSLVALWSVLKKFEAPPGIQIGLFSLGFGLLFAEGLAMLIAVRHVADRKAALRALAIAPVCLFHWVRGLVLAIISRDGWLRSRPRSISSPVHDVSSAT